MSELTVHELETQHSELLPEREALAVFTFIRQRNVAVQANIASILAANVANQANVAIVA